MTALPFAAEVAAYLDDCETSAVRLDRRHHPTEDGAVKAIPHPVMVIQCRERLETAW